MFVVLVLQDFEVVGTLRFPVKLDFAPMVGYLPVYATREDAEREFPGHPVAEIREAQPKVSNVWAEGTLNG